MTNPQIEEFGRQLVKLVRDAAVKSCDLNFNANARSPIAKRWRESTDKPNVIIPDCVDETIFHLLQSIDQGSLHLSLKTDDGTLIDLNSDGLGELAGMYMASGGWRTEYAQERFNDDFSDLV